MAAEQGKDLVRRLVEEVWNKGKLAVADELLSNDYVFHHPAGMDLNGAEDYKKLVAEVRSAFPDINFTLDDFILGGDKIVYRWTLRGTHQSEFRGIPPTNKEVEVWGITIERVVGGKLVEAWERYDTLGLMRQLGVVPG